MNLNNFIESTRLSEQVRFKYNNKQTAAKRKRLYNYYENQHKIHYTKHRRIIDFPYKNNLNFKNILQQSLAAIKIFKLHISELFIPQLINQNIDDDKDYEHLICKLITTFLTPPAALMDYIPRNSQQYAIMIRTFDIIHNIKNYNINDDIKYIIIIYIQ